MQKPKKRKLPQSKKTRLNKLRKVINHSPLQAIFNVQHDKDVATLNQVHQLEMTYSMDASQKIIDNFFLDNGYTINQVGIFVPESVVLKAYDYCDLIIALKMQQIECTDWALSADTHFYNLETDQMITVPYYVELNGIEYFDIYKEMPIKVDRGAGIKTRWRGLQAELNRAWQDFGIPDGFKRTRIDMHIVGSGKFLNIDLYEEFQYLKGIREIGKIEELFERMNADAIKHGLLDSKLQPLQHDSTGLPVNVIRSYRKKYEEQNLEMKDSFRVGYR